MNSFDLMIERYKKELIDAKRKSISDVLNEIDYGTDDAVDEEIVEVVSQQEKPVVSDAISEEVSEFDGFSDEAEQTVADLSQNQSESVEENLARAAAQTGSQSHMENIHSTRPGDANLEQSLIDQAIKESVMDPPGGKHPLESFGSLKVQVFAADQVYPIAQANVIVDANENGANKIYFKGYTDTSGIVDDIVLPSPNPNASQLPSNVIPYAQYNVYVEHPRFIKRKFLNVPVFPNIKSIQAVQLVPFDSNEEIIVTESEPEEPTLTEVDNA